MEPKQIVNAIIAGGVVIGTFVLLVMQIPVPDQVWSALLLILGFYFGIGTGEARARAAMR